jgi:putative ABC transport system permease protein
VKLFLYHLRLAALSLRRNWVISAIMLLALAMGNGVWSIAVGQWIRFQGVETPLSPSLHQVEIIRPRDANSFFDDSAPRNPYLAAPAIMRRTQLSWSEARRLAASHVPVRQTLGARAEVLARRAGAGEPPEARMARFTNAAFFGMFGRPFAQGGPWTAADEEAGANVVVLGRATARALFPAGGAVGQTVLVEGRPFRVTGVLAEYQPLNAPWALLIIGGREDALFLPLGEVDHLRVVPDQPMPQTAFGVGRAALLASDARFVTAWVDLPTPQHVTDYRIELEARLGPGNWSLRSLADWRRDLAMPSSQISFFSFLGLIVLVGGAFNLARWLLTKGLTRAEELGVYRALGAPRASIFARTFLEGALLAAPAALLAPVMSLPILWLFNRYIHVVDMPLEVSRLCVVVSIVAPLLMCALGSTLPAWRLARTRPTLYLGGPK